jgi:hypothetical protein
MYRMFLKLKYYTLCYSELYYLTKINSLMSNEVNEKINLLIVSKSENKFPNFIRYNTLFTDN